MHVSATCSFITSCSYGWLRRLRQDAWTLLMVNRPAPIENVLPVYMYVNYGPQCTPDHPWEVGSPTLRSTSRFLLVKGEFHTSGGLGPGGVINIWPAKPFNTVPVIMANTNRIVLNFIYARRL